MQATSFVWVQVQGVCGKTPVKEFVLVDLDRPIKLLDSSDSSPWIALESAVKELVARARRIPFVNMLRVDPVVWSPSVDLINPGLLMKDLEACLEKALYTRLEV